MMKKGLTPGVFNWIFVMLAGAVILLFFIKIIGVQTAITEREIGATVLSDTQTILSGRATSEDTQAIIKIPDKPFEFVCQEPCNLQTGCDSWFGIPGGELQIQTPLQPIFSPRNIETAELYAFVIGWNVPFHTSNFLMLAQPGMKIAFPSSAECNANVLCSDVFSQIPTPLKDRRIVVSGHIDNKNVRNIVFDDPMCSPTDNGGTTYCVDSSTREVTFPNLRTHSYYLAETIVAALFAEDSFAYECNLKKAFFRLSRVIEIYETKRTRLIDDWGINPVCMQNYLDLESDLIVIGNDYEVNSPVNFENAITLINQRNNIIRRNSCGSLY